MLNGIMSVLGQTASAPAGTAGTAATVSSSPTPEEYMEALIPFVAVGGGLLEAIVAIVFGTISGVAKRKSFEESRREIAAYLAEGSMTPQEAEVLLMIGKNIT